MGICKYCEEMVYHDDDGEYFLNKSCKKCGMDTFKKLKGNCCEDVESYSITEYYNGCEMDYGLTTICHCGEPKEEYIS